MDAMPGAKIIDKYLKLSAVYEHFLGSMVKNAFKWMKPVSFIEEQPSSNLVF